ncbi:MAG: glutamate--tRNA ligase [candidate division WOR-3 bacterium]
MNDKAIRVRFAPSPTGYLHLGGARTALYNWLFARKTGGVFILRIEDTDRSRLVPDSVQDITENLAWLGIPPDEGPYFQSERRDIYLKKAQELVERGAAYPCFCTHERLDRVREERRRAGLKVGYDRACRNLSPEEASDRMRHGVPHVIRLKVPLSGEITFVDLLRGKITYECRELEDIVLLKSDGWPTYHLANVVDDHDMGITHIMRADEWLPSVPYHVIMYEAFGWEPPLFVHLPVILSPDGKGKMSKRAGAFAIREVRAEGYLPEAVVNYLALLGWSPGDDREIMSLAEMAEKFSLERLSVRGAVFSYDKLLWMNGEYLRATADERLFQLALSFYEKAGYMDQETIRRIIPLFKDRVKTLSELPAISGYFFREPESYDEAGVKKHFKGTETANILMELANKLSGLQRWEPMEIERVIRALAEHNSVSAGKIIHPARLALSGMTFGPGLFEMMAALGKETCLARLRRASEWIEKNLEEVGK